MTAFNLHGYGFLLILWKGAQNEYSLSIFIFFSAAQLNNIDSEDEVFAKEISCEESDFWNSDNEYI